MHESVLDFAQRSRALIGLSSASYVLEIGSYNVNGTVRPFIEAVGVTQYVATDFRAGPGVDHIINCCELSKHWFEGTFDLTISCEVLEHVDDWKKSINEMKFVTKPGGYILLTTRSDGFPLHDYPSDYWRFSVENMREIFSDMTLLALESDTQAPGVFVLAKKKQLTASADLTSITVQSMS